MNSNTNQSFVYIIHAKSTRLFKIGISNRPEGRLKELQTANGHELQIIALWHGGKQQEQLLHSLFRSYRAKGEWFEHPEKLTLADVLTHIEMAMGPAVQTVNPPLLGLTCAVCGDGVEKVRRLWHGRRGSLCPPCIRSYASVMGMVTETDTNGRALQAMENVMRHYELAKDITGNANAPYANSRATIGVKIALAAFALFALGMLGLTIYRFWSMAARG